jgi:chaperonin GroEL
MVKPAGMPEQQQAWLDDISAAVGSKLFKVSLNESIIEVKKTDLGACNKFVSNQTTTTLILKEGPDPDHLEYLSEMYETVGNNWLEEQYQNRINRLTTGISTIYVGGASEVEQIERKERVDDAVNACKLALESGVVIGGGADLYRATNHIVPDDGDGPIFCLFCEALTNPIQTIVENSGQPERTYHFLKSNRDYICGKTGKVFSGSDILDPVDVVINSLESAVSIAALVLMTDAAIIAPDA